MRTLSEIEGGDIAPKAKQSTVEPTKSLAFRHAAIFLVYLAITTAVTLPFAIKPTTTLLAPLGGDVLSGLARFEAIIWEDLNPFEGGVLNSVDHPDEVSLGTGGVEKVSFLSVLILWMGSKTIGPVATHGSYAFLGYLLTAYVTFLFVYRITSSRYAAFIAGLAFGFFRYMHVAVWVASTYAHMWLLILPLWAFWNFGRSPTRRSGSLAGLSIVPALFWTPYFAIQVAVIAGTCLFVVAVHFVRKFRTAKLLIPLLSLIPLPLLAMTTYLWIGVRSASDIPVRDPGDPYVQGAHPLMYVVPGLRSMWAGSGPFKWMVERVPSASDTNLYVGLSVLFLAIVGIVFVVRQKYRAKSGMSLAAYLGGTSVIATFLFSLPPRVYMGKIGFPTPSALVVSISPALRAGNRFVMPLMAGLSLLTGIGAYALIRNKKRHVKFSWTILLAVLLFVDLWYKGGPSWQVPSSPALLTLAALPDAPTAFFAEEGHLMTDQLPCILRDQHKQRLMGRCLVNAPTPRLYEYVDAPTCSAIARLVEDGLTYLVVERSSVPVVRCLTEPTKRWEELARDRLFRVFVRLN